MLRGRCVTLPLVVLLLLAGSLTAAAQVAAGGARIPGSTAPREAPLLNWSEVSHGFEYSYGDSYGDLKYVPLTEISVIQIRLETVEGTQRWVRRRFHYDASGTPVIDETWVYPAGTRMVEAVVGYKTPPLGPPRGGLKFTADPVVALKFLIPIPSDTSPARRPHRVNLPARVNVVQSRPGSLAQALGYRPLSSQPARSGRPEMCEASTPYASDHPPLQASCVLLNPGQAVDLPNQVRVMRVGNNYRVMVNGSVVDDLERVTIVRLGEGYYTMQDVPGI
jgi:hypothetical protein